MRTSAIVLVAAVAAASAPVSAASAGRKNPAYFSRGPRPISPRTRSSSRHSSRTRT